MQTILIPRFFITALGGVEIVVGKGQSVLKVVQQSVSMYTTWARSTHSHSLSSSSFISTLSVVLFVGKLQRKSKLCLSPTSFYHNRI